MISIMAAARTVSSGSRKAVHRFSEALLERQHAAVRAVGIFGDHFSPVANRTLLLRSEPYSTASSLRIARV